MVLLLNVRDNWTFLFIIYKKAFCFNFSNSCPAFGVIPWNLSRTLSEIHSSALCTSCCSKCLMLLLPWCCCQYIANGLRQRRKQKLPYYDVSFFWKISDPQVFLWRKSTKQNSGNFHSKFPVVSNDQCHLKNFGGLKPLTRVKTQTVFFDLLFPFILSLTLNLNYKSG